MTTGWQIVVVGEDGRERIVALFVAEAEADAECATLRRSGLRAVVVPLTFDGCGCGA